MQAQEAHNMTCESMLRKRNPRKLSDLCSNRMTDSQEGHNQNFVESTSANDQTRKESNPFGCNFSNTNREKNKMSAKEARKRKRLRTNMLEKKIKLLNEELNFLRRLIKLEEAVKRENIFKFKSVSYFQEELKGNSTDYPLKRLCSMDAAHTAPVLERKKLLDLHFDQFMEQNHTPFSKYFFHSARCNTGFFQEDISDLFGPAKNLSQQLQLNPDQLSDMKLLQPEFRRLDARFCAYESELKSIKEQSASFIAACDLLVKKFFSRFKSRQSQEICTKSGEEHSRCASALIIPEEASQYNKDESSNELEDGSASFYEELILGKREPTF